MSDHKQSRLSLGRKRKIVALLVCFFAIVFFAYIAVNQGGGDPLSTVLKTNEALIIQPNHFYYESA